MWIAWSDGWKLSLLTIACTILHVHASEAWWVYYVVSYESLILNSYLFIVSDKSSWQAWGVPVLRRAWDTLLFPLPGMRRHTPLPQWCVLGTDTTVRATIGTLCMPYDGKHFSTCTLGRFHWPNSPPLLVFMLAPPPVPPYNCLVIGFLRQF